MSLAEEKKSLALKQELYEESLQKDLVVLEGDYKKIGLWALAGAAAILGGYLLVKRFSPAKKPSGKKSYVYDQQGTELVLQNLPPQESPLVAKIKEHIALFVLSILKEKLSSLLKEPSSTK